MLWQCFKMFDVCRRFALDPARELKRSSRTRSWIYGAYFLLNTNLSPAKNNAVLSLGQTDGHCYMHDSLKYTLKIQLYGKLQ